MSQQDLPTAYSAKEVEPKWYSKYEKSGFFRANAESSKPSYCIMIPPPNVTGVLHMGHALVNTLQDIVIRWKKMSGFETLWMPGTDHAGIATQTVVERHLIKTTGKRRVDFPRDEFVNHIWNWKEKSETTIISQLKSLGCACDWSRTRFTLDEGCSKAVRTMFKRLYDKDLIYQGDYLVDWDPVTGTALANDEVEYEERQGFLWHIKYPVIGGGEIIIATTRPETMLGDTAVAVNPHDARYGQLIGKMIDHPITGRRIPIIADHFVDKEFGTGAVKITPAHDHNDYQMAGRHNLPMISIMDENGTINENGAPYTGRSMTEAREKVVHDLQNFGLLVKKTPHTLRVGLSYRSKAVLEPRLSKQWFVRLSHFKETLRSVVETGKVKLVPEHWNNTYFHWIDNLHDWCISRQLWWGHRIPIWYRKDNRDIRICFDGEGLPEEVRKNPEAWEQDADVLDTWFSSALWPFSTLGWPDKTPDLKKFYPNATLITGHDILFFWVARMIMAGEFALGEVPFKESFLHGLIYGKSYWRDAAGGGVTYVTAEEQKEFDLGKTLPKDVKFKWEKMSKTKGNVIDPIEIINEYGADACRFALASSTTEARQIDLDRRKFEDSRNFANKVWNGSRFVLMNLGDELPSDEQIHLKKEDLWILSRLQETIAQVESSLTRYAFDKASISAYEFFWNEFCAYYVEMSKPALFGKTTDVDKATKQTVCFSILSASVRLLHPFAPFITDEIFSFLKGRFKPRHSSHSWLQEAITSLEAEVCFFSQFPKVNKALINKEIEEEFTRFQALLLSIRAIRGEMKIAPTVATDLLISSKPNSKGKKLIDEMSVPLKALVRIGSITEATPDAIPVAASKAPFEDIQLIIPIPQELLEKESARLKKEIEKLTMNVVRTTQQLETLKASNKAPQAIIDKTAAMLVQQQQDLATLESQLVALVQE